MSELSSTQKGAPRFDIVRPDTRPIVRPMTQAEANVIQQFAGSPVVMVEQAFQSQEGAYERTSGMDRSWALVVRLLPFSIVWLVLACWVAWHFNRQSQDIFLMFGLLTAITYYCLDKSERYDSRHGVEHHKIDSAVYLTERKLDHDHELKRMALEATLKQLEVRGNDY